MAVHRRQAPELGFMSLDQFKEALSQASQQPTFIPNKGKSAVLMKSGYAAHTQQARPPKDALSTAVPKHWSFAECVQVIDVSTILYLCQLSSCNTAFPVQAQAVCTEY